MLESIGADFQKIILPPMIMHQFKLLTLPTKFSGFATALPFAFDCQVADLVSMILHSGKDLVAYFFMSMNLVCDYLQIANNFTSLHAFI